MYQKKYQVIDDTGCDGITKGKKYFSFKQVRLGWVCLYNNIGREVWYPFAKVEEII